MTEPSQAIEYMIKNAGKYAKAKAERIYAEEFRKSLKSILMKRSNEGAIGAQEREAYAHQEYLQLLAGLKDAVEIEEKLRWELIAAQARIECWKAQLYADSKQDKIFR